MQIYTQNFFFFNVVTMVEQTFWDTVQRDGLGYPQSGGSLKRADDQITYEFYDYDHEDNRMYEYFGLFLVADYQKALEELQRTGRAHLRGDSAEITMQQQVDMVEFCFSGTPGPCSTPGGAGLSGSVRTRVKLEKLVLD
jgi:hypothetical protein